MKPAASHSEAKNLARNLRWPLVLLWLNGAVLAKLTNFLFACIDGQRQNKIRK